MKNYLKGSFALLVSRMSAGLNINCTKYLLPVWIAPVDFIAIRLLFGTLFFWTIGAFASHDATSKRDKVKLFLLGATMVFGYMTLYAVGLTYTTPVNFAIFNALQPIWVFAFSVVCRNESVTVGKVAGICLGFSGVVATLFSEAQHELASNALLGNTMALVSSLCYAVYLFSSTAMLRRVSNMAMLKYTFFGAAASGLTAFVLSGCNIPRIFLEYNSSAVLLLLFVLVFPTALSYLLVPIGLKYLKTTLVAMYGYVTLFVATIVSLFTGQDRFDVPLLLALLLICVGIFLVGRAERAG